jgi:hypothetical protein
MRGSGTPEGGLGRAEAAPDAEGFASWDSGMRDLHAGLAWLDVM